MAILKLIHASLYAFLVLSVFVHDRQQRIVGHVNRNREKCQVLCVCSYAESFCERCLGVCVCVCMWSEGQHVYRVCMSEMQG